MKTVLLNGCDTGQTAESLDGALVAIRDYADLKFENETEGKGTPTERRELAVDILLRKHERNHFPRLTPENSEETADAFIIYL